MPTLDIKEYLTQNLTASSVVDAPKGYIYDLDLSDLQFADGVFEYKDPTKTPIPEPFSVDSLTDVNDTSLAQTIQLERTYKTSATLSWSVTQGIKVGEKTTLKLGAPPAAIHLDAEFSFELSTSKTNTQTSTTDQSWTVRTPVNVPPHKKVTTNVSINKANFKAAFKFKGELKGRIKFFADFSPKGTEPSMSQKFEGNIADFFPGMPLPPQISLKDGLLFFNGEGNFDGVLGLDISVISQELPL